MTDFESVAARNSESLDTFMRFWNSLSEVGRRNLLTSPGSRAILDNLKPLIRALGYAEPSDPADPLLYAEPMELGFCEAPNPLAELLRGLPGGSVVTLTVETPPERDK